MNTSHVMRTSVIAVACLAAAGSLTACSKNPSLAAAGPNGHNAGGGFTAAPIGLAMTHPGLGSMAVTKVSCGLKAVRYGAPRRADGTPGVAHAAPGRQFCALYATFTNTEAIALTPSPFSSFMTSDGRAHAENATVSTMVATYSPEHPSTSRANRPIGPGQSTSYRAYFEVPTSTKASTIGWPLASNTPAGTFVLS